MPARSELEDHKDFSAENCTRQFNIELTPPLHSEPDTGEVSEPRNAYQSNKDERVDIVKSAHPMNNITGLDSRETVIKNLQYSYLKNYLPYQLVSIANEGLSMIVQTASKIKDKKKIK